MNLLLRVWSVVSRYRSITAVLTYGKPGPIIPAAGSYMQIHPPCRYPA